MVRLNRGRTVASFQSEKSDVTMKTSSITAVLLVFSTLTLTAQIYTPLHYFTNSPGDGAYPQGSLIQGPDGTLYGTTTAGGTNGSGTVFKINPDGSGYQV